MKLHNKLMLLTAIFSTFSYMAQAQYLSAKDIYKYAKSRNYSALSRISRYIDTQDGRGNTALCLAVIDDDYQTYNLLRQYGANPQPYCLQSAMATNKSGTFLGMGTAGWLTVGAVVAVGAGVAVAAGGGGGGSGSSSSDSGNNSNNGGGNNGEDNSGSGGSGDNSATKYLDNEPITDTDNGQEIVGKTVSINNFESEVDYLKAANNGTIKKIVQSQSAVSGIVSENAFTSSAVSIDGNKKADIIIAQRGNGDVYGIKGAQSNTANNTNSDDEGGAIFNATATGNGKATGDITIRNTGAGTGNIYGLHAKGNIYVGNALGIQELLNDDYEMNTSVPSATGNILIENINSTKNVYGISSKIEAINAESNDNAKVTGNVTIKNSGNGNVYGIKTSKDNTRNAGATENSEATALIDIKNTGNGNVYGMNEDKNYPDGDMYNAQASEHKSHDGDYNEEYHAKATATINIENTGTGNVYGIKALTPIYNAHSYYNSTATGKIIISNNGNGNAYGIHGNSIIANALTRSDNSNQHPTAKGYVSITNKSSGNAYGLYSNIASNNISNNSVSDGKTQQSVIELTNQGNGLAVGIYSKNGTVENSGDIKIHNLADGVAVGIYADGSTNATNSGNITIDRGEKSTRGGKAIGIYGAAGSNITNTADGIIRINGADKAYGIYTEGSNVANNGKIYIDNALKTDQCTGSECLNENHAIVLNGGTLFQNGTLYAESPWYNPCQSVTCGANATCSVVGNSGVCQCNAGYEGNANTGCTLIAEENDDVFGEQTSKNIGKEIEGIDEEDGDGTIINYAYNNSDVKLNTNSNNTVIGLRIISEESANAGKTGNHTASVNVRQSGNGNVYGIRSEYGDVFDGWVYNALAEADTEISQTQNATAISNGLINVLNKGNGDVYGMSASQLTNAAGHSWIEEDGQTAYANATGRIHLVNDNESSNGNMYGMYGNEIMGNAYTESDIGTTAKATGVINLINKGSGYAYGMYAPYANNNSDENATSTIEMVNKGNGLAVGIYSKDGAVVNSGEIKIHNLGNGKAIGIYADGTTNVTNSGTITIDRANYTDDMATENTSDDVTYTANSSTTDMAIGIYGATGSTITNANGGKIYINGASNAYGIYTEGSNSSVINNGTILINGQSSENAIHTNGGTLFQNGILYVTNNLQNSPMSVSSVKPASLNLNDFGGTVVASDTSQFIVEGAISGDLAINNSVIENGFDTTYSVKDMIQAEDTNGLKLYSQSALFDATLQNNTDAVMTMKAFNAVVENSSVADFLQNNYAANNNEDLFKTLKSAETVAQLNSNIDDLFGKNMFSRMAFEDLSMIREVSFDMNNHLFEKEGSFAFGENISPSSYDNNIGSVGRYSLNGYNNGKTSFGLGISITDVRTDDGHSDNRRFDRNFMMSAPIGYKTHGFELITAPKMGYADGTYDRDGFNNMTYEGKIQKRMFALMNEARYPLKLGSMKLIPSAEFNMIGYNIKGHEDEKQYALRVKSQNHYSVEAGFGLMAEKEFKPYKNHKFNINGGVAVYHEFANPYELEVGMSGMDGYYKLQDEKRSDNRAVVRFGFGYELKDNIDVSASWLTNVDHEYRTDANVDLKYHF